MQSQCGHCSNETFYSCITCHHPICNRPQCSTAVPPSTSGYSEEHPKQIARCKNCKVVKKKTSNTTSSGFSKSKYVLLKRYVISLLNENYICKI